VKTDRFKKNSKKETELICTVPVQIDIKTKQRLTYELGEKERLRILANLIIDKIIAVNTNILKTNFDGSTIVVD